MRASAGLPRGSSGPEADIKAGSAGAVADSNAAAVRANDFHDDRQAKPGSLASRALARQKRSKMRGRSSRGMPGPLSRTLTAPSLAMSTVTSVPGAVCASAFSIRLRSASAIASAFPVIRTGCAGQCDRAAAGQGQMGHRADHLFGDLAQIDR